VVWAPDVRPKLKLRHGTTTGRQGKKASVGNMLVQVNPQGGKRLLCLAYVPLLFPTELGDFSKRQATETPKLESRSISIEYGPQWGTSMQSRFVKQRENRPTLSGTRYARTANTSAAVRGGSRTWSDNYQCSAYLRRDAHWPMMNVSYTLLIIM